ncbi:MAG: hypothetical protein HY682_02120 [Chloroflexi bacterium]|nr:hypothetical protein [Chloroflexota bacterium]
MTTPRSSAPRTGGASENQLIEQLREIKAREKVVEDQLIELQAQGPANVERPNGAAVAAILAAAIGVFFVGFWTSLAEASDAVASWLNFYNPTGPLSGKTTMSVVLWIAAWVPAHFVLRNREIAIRPVILATAALIVLGVLLTFPPIFELFAG